LPPLPGPLHPDRPLETPGLRASQACLDRDDQKFLEVARDSGARALLSRDKLVLKLGRRPVIASRFAILTPSASSPAAP
jgi:predicted nucleic acid-binding protein